MIERYDEVRERNFQFQRNLIGQTAVEIFRRGAEEDLNGYQLRVKSIPELFPEYFEQPKKLGSVDELTLRLLAIRSMAYAETSAVPPHTRAAMFELAGSAIWESAFIQTVTDHNHIHSVDERLDYIRGYTTLNKAAQKLYGPDKIEYHRLSLRNAFGRALEDVVCGDVTAETVEETLTLLTRQLEGVRFIQDHRQAEGLVGEIKVLQLYWQQYQKKGDPVALPSTVRGGDGHFLPDETHDIDIIRQRKDSSWIVMPPIEVKKYQLADADLQRYTKSLLAYVSPDGSVSVTSSHRAVPKPQADIA